MSLYIDITHPGRDERGRAIAPVAWCAAKCDGCGGLGPVRSIDGEHDTFGKGMAMAEAHGDGWVDYLDGNVTRVRCPRCATLAETLRSLGYGWQRSGQGQRTRIERAGECVFVGRAGEVWDWLTATWRQRCGWAEATA